MYHSWSKSNLLTIMLGSVVIGQALRAKCYEMARAMLVMRQFWHANPRIYHWMSCAEYDGGFHINLVT
jgi:hypothetical protein